MARQEIPTALSVELLDGGKKASPCVFQSVLNGWVATADMRWRFYLGGFNQDPLLPANLVALVEVSYPWL